MSSGDVVIEHTFPAGTYRVVYDPVRRCSVLFELVLSGFGFFHYVPIEVINACSV